MPDRRNAAATWAQKISGRLSYSSTVTQATVAGSTAAHSARAVVLPAPAGPVTTVSGPRRLPWAISLVIRGRGTAQSGTPGAVILVARIGTSAQTVGLLAWAATCLAAQVAIGSSPVLFPRPAAIRLLTIRDDTLGYKPGRQARSVAVEGASPS